MIDLGTLGNFNSIGYGINDNGQVTGVSHTNDGGDHAFLYSNSILTDIGTLGGTQSYGTGINNAGQIAGSSTLADDHTSRAFRWTNGVMTNLGTLGGKYSHSYGKAINSAGHVTGDSTTTLSGQPEHAFLSAGGAMVDLGTLGGSRSSGLGINSTDQITGWSLTSGNTARHAFVYSGGSMIDIGALADGDSIGNSINDSGQVTGSYISELPCSTTRAFVYRDGMVTDLNDLIDPLSGWLLVEGTGINNKGQITGYGILNNEARGFVLTALTVAGVPEPASWAMLIAGFGLTGSSLRRRRMVRLS